MSALARSINLLLAAPGRQHIRHTAWHVRRPCNVKRLFTKGSGRPLRMHNYTLLQFHDSAQRIRFLCCPLLLPTRNIRWAQATKTTRSTRMREGGAEAALVDHGAHDDVPVPWTLTTTSTTTGRPCRWIPRSDIYDDLMSPVPSALTRGLVKREVDTPTVEHWVAQGGHHHTAGSIKHSSSSPIHLFYVRTAYILQTQRGASVR